MRALAFARAWPALILAFALAEGLWAPPARADQKIGYINSQQILEKYTGTASAMAGFNRDVDGWNQDAAARKADLDAMGKELTAQSPMLSEDKRRQKERDYQAKLTEYDQFIQSIRGPQGLIVKRNEEILRPIIAKIQTVLAKIATDQGYDLILDAANGTVLYADPTLDLTQKVIDALNQQQP